MSARKRKPNLDHKKPAMRTETRLAILFDRSEKDRIRLASENRILTDRNAALSAQLAVMQGAARRAKSQSA